MKTVAYVAVFLLDFYFTVLIANDLTENKVVI